MPDSTKADAPGQADPHMHDPCLQSPQPTLHVYASNSHSQHTPSPNILNLHFQYLGWHTTMQQDNCSCALSTMTHHIVPNADIIAAIAAALGPSAATNIQALHSARRFFSKVIMNTTSELPIAVIKELNNGFKNYIPRVESES